MLSAKIIKTEQRDVPRRGPLSAVRQSGLIKRLIDILVSSLALVILAPVLLVVAFLLRLTMGSPVLFRQERPGLHGQPFNILKFRTMKNGDGPDSERLTRMGAFLRSTSLDELPELVNVLKGEMSLVGPRPLLMEYLPLYDDRQSRRHEVRPGITGLAQVEGRNLVDWPDRLERDVLYVEGRDLVLDMRIILKTVSAVVKREGINGEGSATMTAFRGSAPQTNAE